MGTTSEELTEIFSKHGDLGRIVLPPSGITGKLLYQPINPTGLMKVANWIYKILAIVEFMDPSEARNAFTRLAYSKFKHLPLYLEWAPEETFLTQEKSKTKSKKDVEMKTDGN
jgi:multiple RNA-binding domain-containing protein 1